MIKTPLNLAMLGDPAAQQYCEMLSLAETFAPLTDGGCGPTGVVLAVDAIRITFPSCVDIVATTGIEVNVGGAGWEAVASVSGGSDRVWEFETTTEIAEGDVVLWQYLGAEDSIVDCTEAVDVGAIDPVTVRNPLDLTAPTLVSAEVGTVDGSTFVLVFSEDLASADFATGWTIEADATPLTITGATEGPAGTLTITVSEDVAEGQTVTISYDANTGDIADVTGYPTANVLASITDEAVTNNVAGGDITLVSIAVTPDAGTIDYGATQQFTATGTYSDTSTADITGDVTWDSSDDAVATISAGGLATGTGVGTATISATLGAVSGDTTLAIAWTPAVLFAASEAGAWYDPSDFSTMFQDAAGTTPVTAVGQEVRRILDKSGNARTASQAGANAAPLLQQDAGSRYYLDFDGTDDSLATASASFAAADKLTAIYGFHPESTAVGTICELGATSVTTNGTFGCFANNDAAGRLSVQARPTGAGDTVRSTANTYGNGVSTVVSAAIDLSQATNLNKIVVRINATGGLMTSGAEGADTASNFTSQPLFLGRRNSASVPYNGRLYGLIIRGVASSAGEIASAETWMNAKTGAY